MTNSPSKPNSLEELLKADDAQIREWSRAIPTELDGSIHPEEQLVLALTDVSHSPPEKKTEANATVSWWQRLVSTLVMPQTAIAMAAICVVIGYNVWDRQPIEPKQAGTAKGAETTKALQQTSFHVGLYQKKKLLRLKAGQQIPKNQRLVLAFSILKPGGHITIFRQAAQGKIEPIYPCDQASNAFQSPTTSIQFLTCQGQVQQDDLRNETGSIRYIQLQTSRAMSTTEKQTFASATKQTRTQLLRKWHKQKWLHHFDQFMVRVKDTAP